MGTARKRKRIERTFDVTIRIRIGYDGHRGPTTGDAAMLVASAVDQWTPDLADDHRVRLVTASPPTAETVC